MSRKPNILLSASDRQHWHALGSANPEIQTLQPDRFAAAGLVGQHYALRMPRIASA